MIRKFALMAGLVLSGCQDPAVPAASREPPPAAEVPAQAGIRPDGVGPITAATPFDRDSIAALFPGAEVESGFLQDGVNQTPIVTVFSANPESPLGLEIGGAQTGITYVRVDGGDYEGPAGERLMAPWQALNFQREECAMGLGRDINALICRRPGIPSLAYVVGVRGWTQNTVPTETKLAEDGFLREMRWINSAAD